VDDHNQIVPAELCDGEREDQFDREQFEEFCVEQCGGGTLGVEIHCAAECAPNCLDFVIPPEREGDRGCCIPSGECSEAVSVLGIPCCSPADTGGD
jgi:hypothetical protein